MESPQWKFHYFYTNPPSVLFVLSCFNNSADSELFYCYHSYSIRNRHAVTGNSNTMKCILYNTKGVKGKTHQLPSIIIII